MGAVSASTIESWGARLRTPGYLILTVVGIMPILDYIAGLWPLHLADSTWRFGAVGLFSSYSVGMLAQLFLMYALAVTVNDRKVLMAIGVVTALLALVLAGSSASYVLDALQTRGRVTPQSFRRFDVVAAQGFVKLLLVLVCSAILSRSSFKASRRDDSSAPRPKTASNPLIVNRPAQNRPSGVADAKGQS